MHPQQVQTPPPTVLEPPKRSLLDEIVEDNRIAGARYMPVMSPKQAKARMVAIQELKDLCLVEGIDFGTIPGTGTKDKPAKPTLLKPGAEKICAFFGYVPRYTILAGSIEDWAGQQFGEPLFYYHVSCTLLRGAEPVGEGAGSCSSWERKYRYRTSKRSCPACGEQTLIKGKLEYERDPEYQERGAWICYEKRGGCGAKYFGDDPEIMSQPLGDVANPDVADIINTVQKIADKRAYIASTLSATGASQWFTQDLDDKDDDGDTPPPPPQRGKASNPPPPQGNPPLSKTKAEATAYKQKAMADKDRREAEEAANATRVRRIDEEKAKLDAMPVSFEVQMVRAFDGASMTQRIELFGQVKAALKTAFGEEKGEWVYRDFLNEFGVKKSNQFTKLKPARMCFIAQLQALKREMERQQVQAQMDPNPPAPAGAPEVGAPEVHPDNIGTGSVDDWLPDNIGGAPAAAAAPASGLITAQQASELADMARTRKLTGPAYSAFLKSHGFTEGRLVTTAKYGEMMAGLLAGSRQEASA